jgi:2-polyprenyl-6-methoxyphenol hydroxylase-like FAD-dependent oxidoreductase
MNTIAEQNGIGTAAGERKSSVIVSGASFAGLAAAWWMNRLGYAVTVVEVGKALKKGGTPVDIREGVVDVVKRMGLARARCLPQPEAKAHDIPRCPWSPGS